jgi:hypothetical protein
MAPVLAVILVAAPYLLGLLGSMYAMESSTLLRLLALGTLPAMVNALYVAQARVHRNLVTVTAVPGVLSVFILVGSYELLLRFGITGVGVAWLTAQTLVAVFVVSRTLGAGTRWLRVAHALSGRTG